MLARILLWRIDPLLGSRFLIIEQLDFNNGEEMFLRGPCRDGKGQSYTQSVEFDCEQRTWPREAEQSPMLEAVTRNRLVKTQ
jgi:hypothetical protein